MRVVEPNKAKQSPAKKKPERKKRPLTAVIFVLLIVLASVLWLRSNVTEAPAIDSDQPLVTEPSQIQSQTIDKDVEQLPRITGELRQFSGNEFRLFYDNLLQPDLDPIGVPPTISGNDIADARIRQIAEQRGYLLRANPSNELPSVQGYRLHESAHQPWLDLQAAASAAGHGISIVSAYRTVEDQRQLFLGRLNAEGVNIDDVAAGNADEQINTVLITSSIPGYSKHHTGYTFDLLCDGFGFTNFENSTCNDWMIANNYEQAKRFGFIPSYPVDADLQGPDPEAWEYVYVGAELLRQ